MHDELFVFESVMDDQFRPTFKKNLISDKQLFTLKTSRKDGLILQIHHTIPSPSGEICRVQFVHIAFNENGEVLAAVDHRGDIFIIDLMNTKFWLLPNIGTCSVVAFSPYKQHELLVGTMLPSLTFIHTETGAVSTTLQGHTAPVKQTSFSCQGQFCLTVSSEEAIIWDLRSYTQAHRLVLPGKIVPKQVMFIPVLDNILALFQNDVMTVWKFETFEYIRQFSPNSWKTRHIKRVAFTRNGRAAVIGGHSSSLTVVSLDTWTAEKVIDLPEDLGGVKYIEFLPQAFDGGANKVLGILSNACVLHFMDIESSQFLKTNLSAASIMTKFCCSGNGKYVAGILHSGEVNVYKSVQLVELDSRTKSPMQHKKKAILKAQDAKSKDLRTLLYKTKPVLQDQLNKLTKKIQEELSLGRLRPILKEFGEYPEAHRVLVWKTILSLPLNQPAFVGLVNRDIHPTYEALHENFPIDNRILLKNLKRVLSCLAHWCSLFAEVKFLPNFVFPFIKLLKNDPLAAFEVVVTVIVNWCQKWFEYYPFPPLNVLAMVEHVLAEHDSELLEWFFEQGITSKTYAWILLETAFSEVLSGPEWLKLWDHVLSNEPAFLLMAVVAYNIICKSVLKSCKSEEDFEFFYHNQNAIDMKKFISKTYSLLQKTSEAAHPRQYLQPFKPLEKDVYPIFNAFPKHIINYKIKHAQQLQQEKEEIARQMELDSIQRKSQIERMKSEARKEVEEARLLSLEKEFKEKLLEEEEKVAAQRRKLLTTRKELQEKELELLKETKNKIMQQNFRRRQVELQRLIDDLDRKRQCQELEIAAAEAEARQQYTKLECQKVELEVELRNVNIDAPLDMEHTSLQLQQEQLAQELRKLREENSSSVSAQQLDVIKRIAIVDDMLQRVEIELAKEMAHRQQNLVSNHANMKTLELTSKTKHLELEVQRLLEQLTTLREHESRMRMTEIIQSQQNRREVNETDQKIVKDFRNTFRSLENKISAHVHPEEQSNQNLVNYSMERSAESNKQQGACLQHEKKALSNIELNIKGLHDATVSTNLSEKLQKEVPTPQLSLQRSNDNARILKHWNELKTSSAVWDDHSLNVAKNVDDSVFKKREELLRKAKCHIWARKSRKDL